MDKRPKPQRGARDFTLRLVVILLALGMGFPLLSCTSDDKPGGAVTGGDGQQSQETCVVRVAAMKGPTSMGLSVFMSDEQAAEVSDSPAVSPYSYRFSILEPPETIFPLLIKGDLDIALVPANAAAILYGKSGGAIQVLSINALGSLYVVSADNSIDSLDDLNGRTVLMTGRGATPEYVMNMLLAKNGLTDVKLEYKSEMTELAATIAANPNAIAIMPEPFVSSVIAKQPSLAVRLSLADVWKETVDDESSFVLGVTVVRAEFARQHSEAVSEFLQRQAASVKTVTAHPDTASQLVAELGFIDNADIAAQAIPKSNLVCITGQEMKRALNGYLAVLYAQDPASIGGALPDDDFFYAEP